MTGDPDKKIRNQVIFKTFAILAIICGLIFSGCVAVTVHIRLLEHGEPTIVAWVGSIGIMAFAAAVAFVFLMGLFDSDK